MARKLGVFMLGLAILFGLYSLRWRAADQDVAGRASTATSTVAPNRGVAARTEVRPVVAMRASSRPSASPSALARERMLATDDLAAELNRLESSNEVPAADKLFYRAFVLESCAGYQESVRNGDPQVAAAAKDGALDRIKSFIAGLVRDERQKAAMEYNLKRKVWNGCRGFAGMTISSDEIESAYAAAAAAGNPAAQARMVNARQSASAIHNADSIPKSDQRYAAMAEGPVGYPEPTTGAEQQTLLNALFSQDPVAIRTAGNAMSVGTDRQSLRVGPQQLDLGPNAEATWALVACDFGFECGQRNMAVNVACAEQLRCADDFASYLRDYVMTPTDFATVEENARLISDAIVRHDMSAFQWVDQGARVRTLIGAPARVTIR
jgi:hypothetical protein